MKPGTDAPKPALPAKIAPRPADDAEGDAPLVPSPPAKPSLFPTGLSRAIVVLAIAACLTWAAVETFTDRFVLIATSDVNNSFVYRIDRLAGTVSVCGSIGCTLLRDLPAGTSTR